MNYREALAWLYALQRFGIKLGLDNIRRLLSELRLPDNRHRIVHVAGTNGKGSVCVMLASICAAAGFRTGLFTSPHLVTFRERIQVNGEMISEEDVAAGLTSLRAHLSNWNPHPTFFEVATALALQHFANAHCDIVILEAGLGGRLDATNAVHPAVSVITPIDLDHQAWLGSTIEEIAVEKAGIIKRATPVVSAPQPAEAERVIRERSVECNASLTIAGQEYGGAVSLAGAHQRRNAALAIEALRAAAIAVHEKAIESGLAKVRWPARFQRWDERTVIDGAHNPASARVLRETWREVFGEEKAALILAVFSDKDVAGILAALIPLASVVILPSFRSERAAAPEEVLALMRQIAPEVTCRVSPSVETALQEVQGHRRVLITGSLHFAGEALAVLSGEPGAFEECAQ
ncbi:MAG: folylpolyglutamate synthase/dihydrofolate synthase family protein [Chthoniobacterales bacterium]